MVDLGTEIKHPEMYPTMNGEDKQNKKKEIMYPHINLPLCIMGETEAEVGQEITITLKGTVKSIIQTENCEDIGIEVSKGEVVGGEKEDEDEGTLLGAAS